MLINSYAKINLYLNVLAPRTDGYHEIETLFSTISLHDSLKFALTKKPGIKILSNIPELASAKNLVYKIADRIVRDQKVNVGIQIFVGKRIPVAAGLGGGSSNAAITLLALKSLLNLSWTDSYRDRMAAEFGSDINFFFHGGMAEGIGRGEQIRILPDLEPLELLLVNPGLKISSREAYELAEDRTADSDKPVLWHNDLEYGIVKRYPVMEELLSELKYLGALKAMMSGSGSTCLGLFDNKAKQQAARRYFKSKNFWCETVKTLGRSKYKECIQNLS